MIELENNELLKINGGGLSGLNGAILTAFKGVGSFLFSVGQSVGSSIRRMVSGRYCPV